MPDKRKCDKRCIKCWKNLIRHGVALKQNKRHSLEITYPESKFECFLCKVSTGDLDSDEWKEHKESEEHKLNVEKYRQKQVNKNGKLLAMERKKQHKEI